MIWNLERVEQEVQTFAQTAREILGDIKAIKELEKCPIEISNRMTRTKGQFEFKHTEIKGKTVSIKPIKIKIARYLLDNYYDEDIIHTIRHECVHLIVDVKYNKNMGHNKTFKQFCQMLGVSDETYFTAEPKKEVSKLDKPKRLPIRFEGICTECGRKYTRKRMSKDTIHDWLYYSTCACNGKLHIKDLKEEIVYMQSEYECLTNTVTIEEYGTKENKDKTVEDYIEDATKLGAYDYIQGYNEDEYESKLDCLWWDLCLVYDNDKEYLSNLDIKVLKKWLMITQPYTIEFKDVSI